MSYIREIRALVGHRPLILVGVQVLLFDEQDRILLQYRVDDNAWGYPGGYMELGESTEETARRELKEETGLDMGTLQLFNVFSGLGFSYVCPNGDEVSSVCIIFFSRDSKGNLQADGEEGSELKFFSLGNMPPEMLSADKMIIESFLDSHLWMSNSSKG